jgi:hypothetical protein
MIDNGDGHEGEQNMGVHYTVICTKMDHGSIDIQGYFYPRTSRSINTHAVDLVPSTSPST